MKNFFSTSIYKSVLNYLYYQHINIFRNAFYDIEIPSVQTFVSWWNNHVPTIFLNEIDLFLMSWSKHEQFNNLVYWLMGVFSYQIFSIEIYKLFIMIYVYFAKNVVQSVVQFFWFIQLFVPPSLQKKTQFK